MRELVHNFKWGFSGEPEFMLIENGRVVVRDPSIEPFPEADRTIDLAGQTVLPAFIDAHCHILPTGLDLQKLNLSECTSHEQVLDLLRERERETPDGEWLLAVQYDQTKFPNSEHMNRDELDSISTIRPILIRHFNGHASIANSAALKAAGVDEKTPDPKGGTYVRDASGRLTGVLLEHAHERVSNTLGAPPLEQMVDAIMQAGDKMAALGIACASDMMTGRYDLDLELQAYRIAAERGCKIRTRLYMQWSTVFGPKALPRSRIDELAKAMNPERCKIAGIKIFADGAIGSGTAAIYGRFFASDSATRHETQDTRHPSDGPSPVTQPALSSSKGHSSLQDGQLMYSPDRLKKMVHTAHDAGYAIAIHSIGDRSTDLVMDTYEGLDDARRHRIEHAMILSDAQIERMAKLGIHCTMQPEFLLRFRHSYMKQLGPERASKLKRFRSVLDAGIPVSFNSDRPIVPGAPWDGINTAICRPEGYDPCENITRNEAILAYTHMGAVANRESEEMGMLKMGQMADYQVVNEPPPLQ